jgi:hypothetical protein
MIKEEIVLPGGHGVVYEEKEIGCRYAEFISAIK